MMTLPSPREFVLCSLLALGSVGLAACGGQPRSAPVEEVTTRMTADDEDAIGEPEPAAEVPPTQAILPSPEETDSGGNE